LFVLLFGAACFLTAGACLVFAILCAIFELLPRRRALLGTAFVVLAPVIVLFADRYLFRANTIQASARLLPPRLEGLIAGLYLFAPAIGVLLALRNRFFSDRAPAPGRRTRRTSVEAPRSTLRSGIQRASESPFLVLLAIVPLYYFLPADDRRVAKFEYYGRHGMWQQILSEARQIPLDRYTLPLIWDINRSLYQAGQLSENMFCYTQVPAGLVPPVTGATGLSCLAVAKAGDLWLDLGYLEESEHMAHDLLACSCQWPATLQRLALINIVKKETGAARVFLSALNKDLVYGETARRDLKRLDTDPDFAGDPEVQRLRSLRITEDSVMRGSIEDKFLTLLKANSRNRMAFEYLMAHYLLTCRPDKVAQNISRLDDFGYRGIPRHYEEALLVYTAIGGKPVDLRGRNIRPETMERFAEFCKIIARHGTDVASGLAEAAQRHSDTYYFYFFCARGTQRK
jgi:hypothetical protein